jgi:valyl-tRNA synthetase
MFGRKMLFGINASVLPASVTAALSTEEQLAEAVSSIRSIDAEVHVHDEETVAGVEAGSDDEDTDSRNQLRRAIKRNQSRAFASLQSQAKRMKAASDAKFSKLDVGTCVTVPVPGVDRSKGDLRNIIGECVPHDYLEGHV